MWNSALLIFIGSGLGALARWTLGLWLNPVFPTIPLGTLAATQGSSDAVRRFGTMLRTDHGQAKTEVAALARRHHVAVTDAMMPEAKAEYAKLKGLHGAAFDREFARYMVQDHQKDIADFTKETKSGDPADVRALAQKTLPTLRKHLATARAIG